MQRWSDSAYAISCHETIRRSRTVSDLHASRNFDLLKRLSAVYDSGSSFSTHKIKSHQPLPSRADPSFDDVLGNYLADKVATEARRNLSPALVNQFRQVRQEYQEAQKILADQLQLRQALASLRIQLLRSDQQTMETTVPHRDVLYNWTVGDGWKYLPPIDEDEAILASHYGPQHSYAVLQWARSLIWPSEVPRDSQPPTGITWQELAVNFMTLTGRSLPVNAGTPRAPWYVCQEELPVLDLSAFTFETAVNTFRHSIEHLEFLVGAPLFPQVSRQRVRAPQLLYCGPIKNGLPLRPQMEHQVETLQSMIEYGEAMMDEFDLDPFRWPKALEVSHFVSTEAPSPADDTAQARGARYHQRRLVLRNRRRAGQG
eukprot:Skav208777  [mRNA]  locus=scaffold2301:198674:199789:+ [translate_table: standard]